MWHRLYVLEHRLSAFFSSWKGLGWSSLGSTIIILVMEGILWLG